MSSRSTSILYCVLLALEVTLAKFVMGYTGAAKAASTHAARFVAPDFTFTIWLAAIDDVRRLDERPEAAAVIIAARAYSDSQIFLSAYVTADDVREYHADATGVTIADQLVIEVGGYLANRGVAADRISGKGMGIDSSIGRAVVISFGAPEPPVIREMAGGPAGSFTQLGHRHRTEAPWETSHPSRSSGATNRRTP